MSLNNQDSSDMGNFDSPPARSGGKLKWIFGGCGCLGLLMSSCVVGLVWFSVSKANAVSQEARSFVENSTVVQQYLGSPIAINGENLVQGPNQSLKIEFFLSGPNGEGQATVNAIFDEEAFDFVLGESSLEINGEAFDLNPEEEFKMEIEGLDEL